ncbi:acetyl/propionyl/methylcrotonyl-CoA carboxylase subunit alpha [Novosphingobium sp. G106]|uniref:acetyl/propionyl/methylcrotonyl-CoA carboxylase subunit alpha n=1 Tax=Novosphingobium sp. G106 TaxID=2849500 RepID=UPI001C2D4C93|nr:acetyl/propionyl/methylcrotonyl-CoA carboxylase subunit alpha [Novosphingobium sp. G106]MBV1690520.1 acetyl/propionyl/methylcrotonyl-CoA carboxylase subunit alpha [Novosphingobium sp. G106]
MIKSLLIANRGEIACRIIRTARQLGIRTVAVYSDADAKALHVHEADEAVHIGPSPARESYLVGEKILAAAKATGAEAIHPGYGFLSENAEFAQSVIDAGLIWVGPKPSSITAMGLKDAAKKLMAEAGVPVTPGYMGADQDPALLAAEAGKIGYPVLIKAVAGGGGKGMRLVEKAEDFADMLASCQREAASSFGNAHVLIEKYILSPRHIEVQVFGDSHGNVVHLFERDCSLQRRHQKVIEEAPAPGMDAATREELCCAAVRAAKAVDYVGAGTIEFIADGSEGLRADRIWFMEMNTRLQVEHPVTEEITGVDLVEWQLRVASGEPLPLQQDELSIDGWAMEARLYAEDPENGFLPSTGTVSTFDILAPNRTETGIAKGDTISPFYDPMIAKIVVHDMNRYEAIKKLHKACRNTQVSGVKTNAGFLARLVGHADFAAENLDTGFIEHHWPDLERPKRLREDLLDDAVTVLLAMSLSPMRGHWHGPSIEHSYYDRFEAEPWRQTFGFRLNADWDHTIAMNVEGDTVRRELPDDYLSRRIEARSRSDGGVVFREGEALIVGNRWDNSHGGHGGDGAILSPMPGKIIAVEVAQGDTVTKGQKLLTLEAMKMEHTLTAPFDGVVAELNASAGAQVQVEALLARIEAAAEE